MKILYYSLLGFSLLSSGAAAQGPAEVLHSAQTIALGPHATVGGTVVLPNHNTVLFLTNSESRELVAQCLAPDGHTLWQTSLTRFGRAEQEARPLLDNLGLGRKTRTDQQMQQEKAAAELYPLRIFTAGNDVLLAEHISEEAAKQLAKSGVAGPQECQTYVQRLNEQGSLTQHLFGPRPAPASGKLESLRLSDYADADGYVEVVRETDERAGSVAFWTMHYDLKTNTIRRESLELPATPAHTGNLSQFRHWYQEWAYLGHRPNQTYFCRRTLVSDVTQQPGKQPVTYQVYITDDQGKAAPSGFSTTLDLSKGTVPLYSGTIPSYGELAHIPRYYSQQGASSASTYDEWDTSAGGLGSFYLDRSTGDVLIFGEYGTGELPEINYRPVLQGFFERRYAADGRLVAQLQAPYSEAMRAKQKNLSFKGHPDRQLRFHFDPLTGQSRYGFSPKAYSPESFNLVIDRDLKVQRSEYLADKDQNGLTHTSVQFIESFCGYNMDGSTANFRTYGPTAQEELPVYAALANLRQQAGAGSPDHKFYLNASSPSAGLVIEQPLGIGGTLKVYTFQTEFLSKN